VEAAWQWVGPILDRWAGDRTPLDTYRAGEWGPDAADRLIAATGRRWRGL